MAVLRRFVGRIAQRPLLVFLLQGLFFVLFGVSSLNLVYLFKANIELVLQHGWLALVSGAAWQFAELVLLGYLSAAFFVAFKVCEKLLVDRLADHDQGHER